MIVGKIKLYPNNLEGYMNWDDAVEACKKLGDGWRLPYMSELNEIFSDYKLGKIELGNYGCWSCESYDSGTAWSKGFHTGNVYINPKENLNLVRPVKDVD